MVSNTERYHNFLKNFPARAKQMPSKVLLSARKRDSRSVICEPKLQLLAAIHELQIIIFVLNNLTVLEYTKKIFTSVSLAQGVGYLPSHEPPL